MAKLKIFQFRTVPIYNGELTVAIGQASHVRQATLYVAAFSKAAAVKRLALLGIPARSQDLGMAMGNDFDAIVQAGFLTEEGQTIITAHMPHYDDDFVELTGRDEFTVVGTFRRPGPEQSYYGFCVERKS